jgi:NADPH:quinone reductase-like Zn-dependent oxidoreductase
MQLFSVHDERFLWRRVEFAAVITPVAAPLDMAGVETVLPRIPGHAFRGTVVGAGNEMQTSRIGGRVAVQTAAGGNHE